MARSLVIIDLFIVVVCLKCFGRSLLCYAVLYCFCFVFVVARNVAAVNMYVLDIIW